MTVFRSGDRWRAQPYYMGQRIGDQVFDSKREAKEWHDDEISHYKSSGRAQTKAHTFEELLEHFEKWHLPQVRPGTATRYKVDIDQRIRPFFRYMPLTKISTPLIEEFKAKCAEDLAPKSVNNCLHTLRLLLNKAEKWKMIQENPYGVESLKVPKGSYPWWDKEEYIQRFLEAAKESRYFAVYLLALETGMRYGEIVGLDVEDIDLEKGTIHIHRQWLEREGNYGPPKHGRERWVDFNPSSELSGALRNQIEGRRGVYVHDGRTHGSARANPLVLTANGARPGKSGLAHKYFRACIRRAKVPLICFHGLRHTFASWYMIRHDNVWDLAAILGHSNIKTTMRYAHHSKRARRKPLDLASITHGSHLKLESGIVTRKEQEGKEWRDGRDSNPYSPRIVS